MVDIVKFKKEHLNEVDEHVFGLSVKENISYAQLEALEKRSHAYSVIKNGKVLGCAGVTEYWPGRGEAWAILSTNLKHDFMTFHNEVKKFLDNVPIKRVEAVVDRDFKDGIRWVNMLGFSLEAPCMKAYGRDGKDCILFSRVRNG